VTAQVDTWICATQNSVDVVKWPSNGPMPHETITAWQRFVSILSEMKKNCVLAGFLVEIHERMGE